MQRRALLGLLWTAGALLISASAQATPDLSGSLAEAGTLRWGADQEGGGPYVFPRDDDPLQVTGFEVDIAARLAQRLRLKPSFVQSQWDKLPDMLRTSKIDVVLNGYELTDARREVMTATVPYYVFRLQLVVRRGDERLKGWSDLSVRAAESPLRIGVLLGSAAETLVTARCGSRCEVVGYDGNTDAMREVETGKLDATVQDTPIWQFYQARFPALAPAGAPDGKGYYVAYVQRARPDLARALDTELVAMIQTGELERIYRAYGIWDESQRELTEIASAARFYGIGPSQAVPLDTEPAAPIESLGPRKHGLDAVSAYGGVLIRSAGLTVVLSVMAFPLAIAIGLLVALGRLYGPRWLALPLAAYVEFLRGTPLMLQLYFLFFVLPGAGVVIPAFWTGVLGLAINYSAYESEIYRAGLKAVPEGQMEAALSLGMTRAQALRRIVVPQAMRIVIPPVVNDFIALFKDTSVCSVITLIELTKRFSVLSLSTQATLELMAMTAVLYLGMSYPLSLVSRRLEARLQVRA